MTNIDNNTNMTHSLYVGGKDRTAEVLKRKEMAEKELMMKRGAKIRDQEERMAQLKAQKETEIRERIRQRQQRELERQKAVLDRRCAQLEKMNAKKEEILHKNHEKASRNTVSQKHQKKYAFGSSTPRELSYLEKLNYQQRSTRNSRGSSPVNPQQNIKQEPMVISSRSRMPSRFLLSGHAGAIGQSSSTMTRSVFGSLSNSESSSRPLKTPNKKPPMLAKQKSPILKSSASKLQNTNMTQSLYIPKSTNGSSQAKSISNNKIASAKQHANKSTAQEKPNLKPVIRPRIAMKQPKESQQQHSHSDVSTMPGTSMSMIIGNIKQDDMDIETSLQPVQQINKEPLINHDAFNETERKVGMPENQDVGMDENEAQNDINNQHQALISQEVFPFGDANQLQGNTEREAENGNSDSDANNYVISLLDDTSSTLIPNEQEQSFGKSSTDSNDKTLVEEQLQEKPSGSLKNGETHELNNDPPIMKLNSSTGIILPPEQERESRRQKLNEILQRTRQENQSQQSAGATGELASAKQVYATGISNPLPITNIDKTALAKELIAQRRLQKMQMQQNSATVQLADNDQITQQQNQPLRPTALANELAESGFFGDFSGSGANRNNPNLIVTGAEYYELPGQTIPHQGHIQFQTSLTAYKNTNETNGHSKSAPRTPPDDPHMNMNGGRDDEIHPPEPTLIDFS